MLPAGIHDVVLFVKTLSDLKFLRGQISQAVPNQDPVQVSTTLFNTTSNLLDRSNTVNLAVNVATGSLQVAFGITFLAVDCAVPPFISIPYNIWVGIYLALSSRVLPSRVYLSSFLPSVSHFPPECIAANTIRLLLPNQCQFFSLALLSSEA